MTPFRSKYTVTQEFGERPEYYKQFGLKGHEGIDLVPTGTDFTIYCLADGVVVKDENNLKSGAYGSYVTIWHPSLRKATQYCHMSSNSVELGQTVKNRDMLGIMGASGNTQGAHLHLNLFETDENGVRVNKDNGYFGGIDPKPFLESEPAQVDPNVQAELDKVRLERDRNWNWFVGLCDAVGVGANYEVAVAEIKKLVGLEDVVVQKDNKIQELQTEIADLAMQLKTLSDNHIQMQEEKESLSKNLVEQGEQIVVLQKSLEELKEASHIEVISGWRKFVFDLLFRKGR